MNESTEATGKARFRWKGALLTSRWRLGVGSDGHASLLRC